MCPFPLMRSLLVFFEHLMWLRPSCIPIRGHSCKLFAWCVGRLGCILSVPVFCISMPPILLSWSVGILWLIGLAACCSKPSRPPIRTSKKSSLRCTWSWRAHVTFSMKSASRGFPYSGRGSPQRSRIGRGRSILVRASGRFLHCSTASLRSSLLGRLCHCTRWPIMRRPSRVCSKS